MYLFHFHSWKARRGWKRPGFCLLCLFLKVRSALLSGYIPELARARYNVGIYLRRLRV